MNSEKKKEETTKETKEIKSYTIEELIELGEKRSKINLAKPLFRTDEINER